MRFSPPRSVILGAVAAFAAVAAPSAAEAAKGLKPLPAKTAKVRVAHAVRQYCAVTSITGRGVNRINLTSPVRGTVAVRTKGGRGSEWDLAIVDRKSGNVLTGSAQLGASEYAVTFVGKGQRLALQTCRRSGGAKLAVTYRFTKLPKLKASNYKLKQVRISATSDAAKRRLQGLGIDLADSSGDVYWDALLHSARDEAKLKRAGFSYAVTIRDLTAHDRHNRLAEERASRKATGVRARAALTSGRSSYRTLGEIETEMQVLADQNPGIARTFELPGRSWEGRRIMGLEIAENVTATGDGRPEMVMVGTHHAREWPANEATLEWGYDLINGYKTGNPRLSAIVKGARSYLVPVVNVDGFDVTTTSEGITPGGNYVDPLDSTSPFAVPPNSGNQSIGTGAYKRKNCRPDDGVTPPTAADCLARSYPNTLANADDGVDINRNYGVEWGGPGSATAQTDLTNHGPGPFSEPETEAVRRFTRNLQPSVLITNHTFSGLILRPPGTNRSGPVPDEERLRVLGDAMANQTQFRSQFSYQLYDTTGTTDDYLYDGLGAFSYTPEIGFVEFHPAYSEFTKDYEGRPEVDRFGDPTGRQLGGLREAYTIAGESVLGRASDGTPAQIDSVLQGTAPAGLTLRISKTAITKTSDRPDDDGIQYPVQTNTDPRTTTLTVPSSGRFTWHVNPSRQPRDFSNQPGFWKLTCEDRGNVLEERNVYAERGQVVNLALACGRGGTPEAPAEVGSCPLSNGFRSVNVKRRGNGLRIMFSRRVNNKVLVDVFQTSRGRTVFAQPKRRIRFNGRTRSFNWSGKAAGGKALADGVYYVRFRILDAKKRIDSRRLVVHRKNGRFSKHVGFYLKDRCG
jgi:hypothetical protein